MVQVEAFSRHCEILQSPVDSSNRWMNEDDTCVLEQSRSLMGISSSSSQSYWSAYSCSLQYSSPPLCGLPAMDRIVNRLASDVYQEKARIVNDKQLKMDFLVKIQISVTLQLFPPSFSINQHTNVVQAGLHTAPGFSLLPSLGSRIMMMMVCSLQVAATWAGLMYAIMHTLHGPTIYLFYGGKSDATLSFLTLPEQN